MKLAYWGLALPVASVECERDFSKMKLIKTPLRNRLGNVNLSRLIRLSVDGPSLRQFPFDEALALWHQQRSRRLHAGSSTRLVTSSSSTTAATGVSSTVRCTSTAAARSISTPPVRLPPAQPLRTLPPSSSATMGTAGYRQTSVSSFFKKTNKP